MTTSRVWRDALAVVAVIVTVLLAARQLRPLIEAGVLRLRVGDAPGVTGVTWIRAGAWVAIAASLIGRRYWLAAAGGWLAVVFEIARAVPRIWGDPRYALAADLAAWPVLLAGVAALGLTVVAWTRPWSDPQSPGPLSPRGWWLLGAAAVITAGSAVALPLAVTPMPLGYAIEVHVEASIALATRAVVLVAAALVLIGVHRGLRGPAATVLAAGMAGALAIQVGLPLPLGASNLTPPDRFAQAFALVLAPLLILAAGVTLYRRRASVPVR
jgi:hypothetical protein